MSHSMGHFQVTFSVLTCWRFLINKVCYWHFSQSLVSLGQSRAYQKRKGCEIHPSLHLNFAVPASRANSLNLLFWLKLRCLIFMYFWWYLCYLQHDIEPLGIISAFCWKVRKYTWKYIQPFPISLLFGRRKKTTFPHKRSIFFFRLGAWGSKSMCRIDFPFIIFIDLHGVTTVGPYCTAYTVRVLNVKVSEKYRVNHIKIV